MNYINFRSNEVRDFVKHLLKSKGISCSDPAIAAVQFSGYVDLASETIYFDFVNEKASYADINKSNWFYGNLWIAPYFESYDSGSSNASVSVVSHGQDETEKLFAIDVRKTVTAVDTSMPSRLFFEGMLFNALKLEHDNANANYRVPFLFVGLQISK